MDAKTRAVKKKELLREEIKHFDIKAFNATPVIDAMNDMSFTARDLARASRIYDQMLGDKDCAVFLALAGSTSAAGCMQIYVDLVKNNMVDAIVATGASIVDIGLIYEVGVRDGKDVEVKMTMTSPMCPLTSMIMADAKLRLDALPGVKNVYLVLVWDPPWNPGMMSEELRFKT